MTDEYATLRAAFHAGARIQAWHLICKTRNSNQGRWETLTTPEGREPEFGCEAHLYRVHPEDLSLIAELGQEVGAVPSFRGYANLGVGAYLLEHSAEGEDAELCIVPATEAEKAGRTVGDLRHFEGERDPIPAERMAVRIRFDNVAGLDALEQQLRLLREVHFPASPAHTSEARDYQDAARYRFLIPSLYRDDFTVGEASIQLHTVGPCPTVDDVAAAIDAAMRQEAE